MGNQVVVVVRRTALLLFVLAMPAFATTVAAHNGITPNACPVSSATPCAPASAGEVLLWVHGAVRGLTECRPPGQGGFWTAYEYEAEAWQDVNGNGLIDRAAHADDRNTAPDEAHPADVLLARRSGCVPLSPRF